MNIIRRQPHVQCILYVILYHTLDVRIYAPLHLYYIEMKTDIEYKVELLTDTTRFFDIRTQNNSTLHTHIHIQSEWTHRLNCN